MLLKNYNKSSFLMIVLFCLMVVIFGFNKGNADFENYKTMYESLSDNSSYIYNYYFKNLDIGFRYIFLLFYTLNFSYESMLFTLSLVGLFFILNFIRKFSINGHIALLLYLIFPFILDIVQIRTFVAMIFSIYSIQYLVNSSRKSFIIYFMGIVVASLFHISSIVFLLFYIVKIKKSTTFKLLVITLNIFLYIILFIIFSGYNIPIINNVSYFDSRTSIFTIMFYSVFVISNFIMLKKIDEDYGFNIHYIKRISFITLLFFLPLVSFHTDFFRLYRSILIIFYIIFSNNIVKSYRSKLSLYNLSYILIHFTFSFITFSFIYYEGVFEDIINQNLIIEFFMNIFS